MKRIVVVFFCFLSFGAMAQEEIYQPTNTRHWDLLHTELHLTPQWQTQTVLGKANLTLTPYFYEQTTLELDAKGMEIAPAAIEADGKVQKFTYNGAKLLITLPKTYGQGDTLRLKITYLAKPNSLPAGGSDAITADRGFYFITPLDAARRQFWTQGETEANSAWFPTIDSPNEKHTHDIYLTVDEKLTTLSNGHLISEKPTGNGQKTIHWQMRQPHAVYLTMVAGGNFVKTTDPTFKEFEVSYYTEPPYAPYAQQIFGRTPEMIRYFENLLGVKYPWNKYSQIAVREYVSGAMENTTATVHGESVLKNFNQLVDNVDDGVIAHELFHHWFGDLVTTESWGNLPLNESFADYSEYLWATHKYGQDEGDYVALKAMDAYKQEAQEKQVPLIRSHYVHRSDMFDSHSYAKGGRILHMLRREVGDRAFFAALRTYLTQHAYQSAEVHDLRLAFEKITGRDLNRFFNQWFFRAGHPTLEVSHAYSANTLKLRVKQMVDSSNIFLYHLPLEVMIGTPQGINKATYQLAGSADTTFVIPCAQKPSFVLADPRGELVADVIHQKTPAELAAQYRQASTVFGRSSALERLILLANSEMADTLAAQAGKDTIMSRVLLEALADRHWSIRQRAALSLTNYDGPNFLEIERKMAQLATADPHAAVRADAILSIKGNLNPSHLPIFRKALTDTAYVVRGAAIDALLANNVPDAAELVKKFEHIQDINIFGPVANYYAEKGEPSKFDWFKARFEQLSDMELYQTLGIVGTYLIQTDEPTKLKMIPFLANLAEHNTQWYVRFAATRTLQLIGELPAAKTALKRIMTAETHPRLREFYEQQMKKE